MHQATDLISTPERIELANILASLVPPANYKVVLEVDQVTERLSLTVLKSDPWVWRVFGKALLRGQPNWSASGAFQRQFTSRTYAGLLFQVKESPEFLEFELTNEGSVRYREAIALSV